MVRIALAGAWLAPVLLVGGCPDTEKKFNDFLGRTEDARSGGEGGSEPEDTGGGQLADVSGTFLFALEPVISPGLYLQFLSENTFTPNEGGEGGTLDMILTPLTLDAGSTDGPRMPLDQKIEVLGIEVAEDGSFEADLGAVNVDGSANPLSGAPISATLQLIGQIKDENFVCGSVTGRVVTPIDQDLAGSFFGSERVDPAAATDPSLFPMGLAIKAKCSAVEPEPDAGSEDDGGGEGDAGEGDAGEGDTGEGDTGEGDAEGGGQIACTDEDLSGTYDLQFKTAAQTTATTVKMTLAAGDGEGCYTGTVVSATSGDTLATVTKAQLEDGKLVIFLLDFQIPPGQSALLPNGGVADVTLTATDYSTTTMCGDIAFALKEPFQTTSAGGFAAAKEGSGVTVTDPSCAGLEIPTDEGCPEDDLSGQWDVFFKTAAQANASSVTMDLGKAPEICYDGDVISKTSGNVIASVESMLPVEAGGFLIIFRDFQIPPGASPILPNGGVADVELTTTTLDPESMCGTIIYKLKEPFATTSEGTFAGAKVGSGATVDGHTCDDISK
jgi:hypothetical protein